MKRTWCLVNWYASNTIHRWHVACILLRIAIHLVWRAICHDFSKYRSPEARIFASHQHRLNKTTYGSPEYERLLSCVQQAVTAHYAHNQHHPQHYADGIDGMSLIDELEMLADWVAATRKHHDGDPLASIEHNAQRFGYGAERKAFYLKFVSWVTRKKQKPTTKI